MEINKLNEMLDRLPELKIQHFSEEGLSSNKLSDDEILNICATDYSLMFFTKVEVLGQIGDEHPDLYKSLLHLNMLGGRFSNLRIVYDDESNAVWICYDLNYDELNDDNFANEVIEFTKAAKAYKQIICQEIIDVYQNVNQEESPLEDGASEKHNEDFNLYNFLNVQI